MRKGLTAAIGLIAAILIFGAAFVYFFNQVQLRREAARYPAPGQLVEVNGHKMHIYSVGKGDETLVFLAGWGTAGPVWDFKSLYSKLSDQYQVIVVEKAGYGYSETSDSPRDIDTVLEETRMALGKAGKTGPFILFPHSVSGLEALYWADKYPQEVRAIVGLDIALPDTYHDYDENELIQIMMQRDREAFKLNFGFKRFSPEFFEGHEPLMFDFLSEKEKEFYRAVVYRSYYTKNMSAEGYAVTENARTVEQAGVPKATPMLLIIAAESGDEHRELSLRYLSGINHSDFLILDGGHYIHEFEPDAIAQKSIAFINRLP